MFNNDLAFIAPPKKKWPYYAPPDHAVTVYIGYSSVSDSVVGGTSDWGRYETVTMSPDLTTITRTGVYHNMASFQATGLGHASGTASPSGNFPGIRLTNFNNWDLIDHVAAYAYDKTKDEGHAEAYDISASLIGFRSNTEWVFIYGGATYPSVLCLHVYFK